MTETIDLSDLLRNRRTAANISRPKLAALVGCSESTIKAWEHGEGLLTVTQFLHCLEACGCTLFVKPLTPTKLP